MFIHIVRDSEGNGGLGFDEVSKHINTMIEAFSPWGIYFSFIGSDFVDNDDYLDFAPTVENGLNSQLAGENPHPNAVNIYFLQPGNYDNGQAIIAGRAIIIGGADRFSSTGAAIPASETKTLAHEMGHSLGLYHTYRGWEWQYDGVTRYCDGPAGCPETTGLECDCGDYIIDTNYDPCSGCHVDSNCAYTGNVTCNPDSAPYAAGHTPPISNLMSISAHNCRTGFTEGQARRMHYKMVCTQLDISNATSPEVTSINILEDLDIVYDGTFDFCHLPINIEDGASLTIKTDIEFEEDAKITVEKGGRLYLDGATLKGCDGEYWAGIEVHGDASTGQVPLSNTGYVSMENNSVVEKAEFPLQVYDGGAVIAINSTFKNCGQAAFYDYSFSNLSSFTRCTFTRDNGYGLDDWPPQLFFQGLKFNVTVSDCDFSTINPSGSSFKGIGILSYGSKFSVINNTSIDGYYSGITALSYAGNPSSSFKVRESNLKNNRFGITNYGIDYAVIEDNSFTGIGAFNTTADHRGLMLYNCTGFTVGGNSFTGTGSANTSGVFAKNTLAGPNQIKGNTFQGLYAANRAEADNRGEEDDEGLHYLCNENITGTNNYDFLVFDQGIAEQQGGGLAAKNIFSHPTSSYIGDFANLTVNGIDYYHVDVVPETPQTYVGIERIPKVEAVDCSPSGGSGGDGRKLTSTEEQLLVQEYDTAANAHVTLLASYNALLNGGGTDAGLAAQVDSATSSNASSLKQDLMAYSPYLTTGVLKATAGRDDIFTDTDLDDILSANPDELRSPGFQSFLYAELDRTLVDSILTGQHQLTARTTDEAELTKHKMTMYRAIDRILKSELADTTGLDLTKYRLWLAKKGSAEAEYELVGSYIEEGKHTTAKLVRDSIPAKFGLQGDALTEHGHYASYTDIIMTAAASQVHYASLDSVTVDTLETIADNSLGLGGALAQGLLNTFYGYSYEAVPQTVSGQSSLAVPSGGNNAVNIQPEVQPLTAMPNPASDKVTFRYHLEEGAEMAGAALTVFDIDGRLVHRFVLDDEKGRIEWRTGHLPHGVYFCRISRPGRTSPALKLVLIK